MAQHSSARHDFNRGRMPRLARAARSHVEAALRLAEVDVKRLSVTIDLGRAITHSEMEVEYEARDSRRRGRT